MRRDPSAAAISPGHSYQDYFPSTRQKLAAFALFCERGDADDTKEGLVYFLCNASPRRDFLAYCAEKEGFGDLDRYLESTGCGLTSSDIPMD